MMNSYGYMGNGYYYVQCFSYCLLFAVLVLMGHNNMEKLNHGYNYTNDHRI